VPRPKTKICLALATAGALAAVVVPGAGAQIPWGAGCRPTEEGVARSSGDCGAELVNGRAIAPPGAPDAVKQVIAAANRINGRPYVWGGGHAGFLSKGYDCSGAVSYALHGAGLLETTMVSGQLAYWGEAGPGSWITIYANADHVFMVVAGLRFDTRGDRFGVSGPRWKMASADPRRFVARHPSGL
jgi:cell wall-associated NlpC family hydrolase